MFRELFPTDTTLVLFVVVMVMLHIGFETSGMGMGMGMGMVRFYRQCDRSLTIRQLIRWRDGGDGLWLGMAW